MEQFCCCGAQAGYRHDQFCPFPYFGTNERKVAEWGAAHQKAMDDAESKRIQIKAEIRAESIGERASE